ncbi:Hypothetical predicted protein, partial [Pelobates cultripes]
MRWAREAAALHANIAWLPCHPPPLWTRGGHPSPSLGGIPYPTTPRDISTKNAGTSGNSNKIAEGTQSPRTTKTNQHILSNGDRIFEDFWQRLESRMHHPSLR